MIELDTLGYGDPMDEEGDDELESIGMDGVAIGVAGVEGEGEALSTTHSLWALVATSFETT